MGNVSHLVTRTAALQSSVENGLAEGMPAKDSAGESRAKKRGLAAPFAVLRDARCYLNAYLAETYTKRARGS